MNNSEIIRLIDAAVADQMLERFPATRNRLLEIKEKLEKGKELSEGDKSTLRLNNILPDFING